MKAKQAHWIKRLVIGTAIAALPQILLAQGMSADDMPPPPGPPDAAQRRGAPPPDLPEMLRPAGPGRLPPPLGLGIELSEAQDDAIFDLLHAQVPVRRSLEKKAAKALDELQRLGHSDQFNGKQARALADRYAQALAQLEYNQAESDAKLRALLTPEQRQRLDAAGNAPRERSPGPADRRP